MSVSLLATVKFGTAGKNESQDKIKLYLRNQPVTNAKFQRDNYLLVFLAGVVRSVRS